MELKALQHKRSGSVLMLMIFCGQTLRWPSLLKNDTMLTRLYRHVYLTACYLVDCLLQSRVKDFVTPDSKQWSVQYKPLLHNRSNILENPWRKNHTEVSSPTNGVKCMKLSVSGIRKVSFDHLSFSCQIQWFL